ncbi:hypothetical protein L0F63_002607, partial [Massospora cicadina]
ERWNKILPAEAASFLVKRTLAEEVLKLTVNEAQGSWTDKWVEIKRKVVQTHCSKAGARWRAAKCKARRAKARLEHLEKNCPLSGYSTSWAIQWSKEKATVDKFAKRCMDLDQLCAATQKTLDDERPNKYFLDKFKT